jgi:hypothetical protein
MAKVSTVAFQGKSSERYVFDVWRMDQPFKNVGAVYAVTRRYQNEAGAYSHSVIYIGQTEDLSTRFGDHHKADCFSKSGANCICTHCDDEDDSRLSKEDDLVRYYKPRCND